MRSFLEWFRAGTKVKRWIFLIVIGIALVCFAFSQVLTKEMAEVKEIVTIVIEFVIRFFSCYYWNYFYPKA